MTNNLGAPQVADNQAAKETTINDAVGRIDAALTDILACAIPSANTLAVSASDLKSHNQFDCTNGGLTAGSTLVFASGVRKGLLVVSNESGQTVTVSVNSGAVTTAVATADIALFFVDGVEARPV